MTVRWILVPSVLVAGAVAAFAVLHRPAPRTIAGADLTIASAGEPRSFELPGAKIELQPFASVTVAPAHPSEQRLVVTRGAVRFQVTHDPGRRFVVTAGAIEINDVGTVFTVAREGTDGELVRVSVLSGDVEVRVGAETPRPLHAGESLTTPELPLEPPPAMSIGTRENPQAPRQMPDESISAAPEPEPAPSPPAVARPINLITAKSLLAEATAARQAGDPSSEAQALDALRRQFPHDPRAPIAGFELGILRMDQLGNRRGALEALRTAITLSPRASFREDAEARIVALLDELEDVTGCAAARNAFLSRYPESVHRASIHGRCQLR
jgi:quercetin dioxygenase-like cupin family protein